VSALPLKNAVSFHIFRMPQSPALPVPRVAYPPSPLAILLIGLMISIGGKLSPLPGSLPGALAFSPATIALILDMWVWNKPRAAVSAPNLFHGFSPQETISDGA
jgi:hypothetical protein